MIQFTPQQQRVFQQVLARCNDCQPHIDFLKNMGLDMNDRQERVDLQRQQAETALQYMGVQSLSGKK